MANWQASSGNILHYGVNKSLAGTGSILAIDSYTIPGGKMGANSAIRILVRGRQMLGGAASWFLMFGSHQIHTLAPTTSTQVRFDYWVINDGTTTGQLITPTNNGLPENGTINDAWDTASENTGNDVLVAVTSNAGGGETARIGVWTIEYYQ